MPRTKKAPGAKRARRKNDFHPEIIGLSLEEMEAATAAVESAGDVHQRINAAIAQANLRLPPAARKIWQQALEGLTDDEHNALAFYFYLLYQVAVDPKLEVMYQRIVAVYKKKARIGHPPQEDVAKRRRIVAEERKNNRKPAQLRKTLLEKGIEARLETIRQDIRRIKHKS